jgi:hypothetical protein
MAGNLNSTSVTFSINTTVPDTTAPSILIISPTNNTYNTTNILVNISASDTNLQSIWYNWNGTNVTYNAPIYINFNNGSNILYAYATDMAGNTNQTSVTFVTYLDTDNDGLPDYGDNLLYNQSNVSDSGLTFLNVTINGISTLDNNSWPGVNIMDFYDNNSLLMNFTHNFTANKIDLSKVSIEKTGLSLVVNLSGQLAPGEKKTLYIEDNSFISLCVKDADIASVSQISSGCNEANEMDFTSCLGNSTGITINNITCYDQGSIIRIENLSYSGIKGTQSSVLVSPASGGGGCTTAWSCGSWGECVNNIQTRTCTYPTGFCAPLGQRPDERQSCTPASGTALLDIGLTIIKPQIILGENLTSKISLVNFGNKKNLNVNVNYIISDSNNRTILRETDIVPVGLQNEFIKEFTLPSQVTPGAYKLFAEITYEGQEKAANSQGSFEVLTKNQGSSLTGNAVSSVFSKANYWIIGALLLVIIIVVVYILIKRSRRRREGYL